MIPKIEVRTLLSKGNSCRKVKNNFVESYLIKKMSFGYVFYISLKSKNIEILGFGSSDNELSILYEYEQKQKTYMQEISFSIAKNKYYLLHEQNKSELIVYLLPKNELENAEIIESIQLDVSKG